jgi:hypothetical protein
MNEDKALSDKESEDKNKINVNQKEENVDNEKNLLSSIQLASSMSLFSESEDLSQSSEKSYLTNLPVKLTLEKEKKSIDSIILPSAESASSETYENSIKAFNKVIKKKGQKQRMRVAVEPSKVSQEDILTKASKSQDEEYLSDLDDIAHSDEKLFSPSLKLTQALKAILNKAKQVKESLDTGMATVYTFRYTIRSKINQWKMTTEVNAEFENNSNLD